MINPISVVIIVKNGAKTLRKTLLSVRHFEEVIVFNNGSTDATQEIANEFENVKIFDGSFDGFGQTKNKALKLAKNDWVLILDADEELENSLAHEILNRRLEEHTVYILKRRTFYGERLVRHCGWNKEKIRRLFNRKKTQFTSEKVHENVIMEGMRSAELCSGVVYHYSYQDLDDFIKKINHFSTLYAKDNAGKKYSSPILAVASGIYSFIKTYIFKLGLLDGYVGLIIAFSHMATNFYKYMKLYEENRKR